MPIFFQVCLLFNEFLASRFCSSVLLSCGGASRDRTDDPLRARQVLSQLSYGPARRNHVLLFTLLFEIVKNFLCNRFRNTSLLVGLGRLELPTPRLSSVCSNQLSYRPASFRRFLLLFTSFFFLSSKQSVWAPTSLLSFVRALACPTIK